MSDSQDFETQQIQLETNIQEEPKPFNVKKYLQNPKQIMQKILFTSFKIEQFFPCQFIPIPEMLKADTAQKDNNNMNLIEQSAFRHQKLKKDVLGFLLNNNISKPTMKKNLPSMKQFYENKFPVYEKYQVNPKSKCLATYLLDSKSIMKQQIKKSDKVQIFAHNHHSVNGSLASHRNKIQFNSNFECGNLFRVYQVEYNQFDLVLQNDVNTKGNNQWFFFFVRNVPKGLTIKFNIVNLSKKYSLFDQGMKPYVFSMIRYEKRKVGWVREGMKVTYDENDKFCREVSQRSCYKLSFQYKFTYQGDIVYFSHSIPYRASDLTKFIYNHVKNPINAKLIKFKDLNRTLGNQDLDVLQITNDQYRQNKKSVWIIARQHPGQVTSSFMIQGIINFLLDHQSKSKQLLKRFIFKIVPMLNIDGVIHGNSRAQLNGGDPNRKWLNPHKIRNPVVYSLKKYIEKDANKIEMFLDLHSHSRKLGTFFYGNNYRDNKFITRKFPWMVCKKDQRFTYSQCRFSQCNVTSARHVLFQSLQIPLIYTVQSSFYGYQKNDHRIIQYLPNDYRQMGSTLVQTFWQYQIGRQSSSLSKNNEISFIQDIQQNQQNDKQSIGSDSDPGQDQFDEKQLRKLLPNFYGVKKLKHKNLKKRKQMQKPKKTQKQQPLTPIRPKKNDKQSYYRMYFSGRQSAMQKITIKQKTNIQIKDASVQVSVPQVAILRGSTNMPSISLQKRSSLCIWGQKVQQQVTTLGNCVGLQVDMQKIFQNKEQQRKSLPSRKNFKLTLRASSILQVKQNNFLNRADCHTLPMRSLSKR